MYKSFGFVASVLILLLILGLVLHISSGSIAIGWHDYQQGLSAQQSLVLWQIRLPRLLVVAIVGAGLAVAGVALQALFRNPLAEPGLIGVSSSAALGAVFMIVLGSALFESISYWQLSVAAFASAGLATWFIYALASRYGKTDVALMLLAGVAINAIAGASTQLLISVSNDLQMRSVIFWMMGSFANVSWSSVAIVFSVTLLTSIALWRLARPLNAFMLGENISLHMGFDARRIKWQIMWGTALMVGVAVATVGVIGFVGLIVPHIVRLWVGSDHRQLIPLSALAGGSLLVFADWVAKTLIAPAELPIGLFMALLGGPFFLMMLLKQRKLLVR
ncbi:hemin ABC transporter permease [Thiomicrorhabdus immobilis]|uniref:Hemin ABC transporter permease n=1 Tax=Thiomicrorhabdus immobilis TaxID=2791037 RepID=A0ABN6CYC3_9GAMM|nr:iron ABC transporter permease [Thiomicrorhabdus immobilis]BCN94063.1 hemin ABC transporter permease [Thiomicrorhabdus immobilis]